MGPKRAYGDKLLDPRWQKRRLEILNRDSWKCQGCFATEKTLHVHHEWYAKSGDPWDVPDAALMALCEAAPSDELLGVMAADFVYSLLYQHADTFLEDIDRAARGHPRFRSALAAATSLTSWKANPSTPGTARAPASSWSAMVTSRPSSSPRAADAC